MESVASMDDRDKNIMSESFGDRPWEIDAGTLCWCSRPRLYWISWELNLEGEDVDIVGRRVTLSGHQPWTTSVDGNSGASPCWIGLLRQEHCYSVGGGPTPVPAVPIHRTQLFSQQTWRIQVAQYSRKGIHDGAACGTDVHA